MMLLDIIALFENVVNYTFETIIVSLRGALMFVHFFS